MNKADLTKEMRWEIADKLAEDRLPIVNELCENAVVRKTFYSQYIKRMLDIFISGIALVITAPINLVLALCTFMDVGRPIFFRQKRLGKDGELFEIIKFRNMRNTVDERGELLPPAQRVTKFGKFVRKTSLDELLNFWSIFKGDMSVIGPRPLVPEYYGRFNKRHIQRLAVKPGLECPPRGKIKDVLSWQEQFENDIWYVEHISLFTDCYMIFQLIRFALDRKSANTRSVAGRGIFMGYNLEGKAINLNGIPQELIDQYLGD